MSNRLSRDTEDAAKVLVALRDKYHPREALREKLSASEDLRAKLVNVASGLRQWSIKSLGDDTLVTLNDAGTVLVHTDPATGHILVGLQGTTLETPALEYDAVSHDWIGREADPHIAHAPGERLPRKSALVALTEHIVQLLDKPNQS